MGPPETAECTYNWSPCRRGETGDGAGGKDKFNELMTKIFPSWMQTINPHIQEDQWVQLQQHAKKQKSKANSLKPVRKRKSEN